MKEEILSQFDEHSFTFQTYGEKCIGIIKELIKDKSLQIHNIVYRIKDKKSIEKKIDKKKGKYNELGDITDICGIRIITYLESDVDTIADIIEKEFNVDIGNSVDKRKLEINQFGYKSLHYVVSLDDQRLASSENKKYAGYKFEIQIRSILQHAWAEIEHDLGYKGEVSLPDHFKRRFNRLAALLEVADAEFDMLKADLSSYERSVVFDIESNPDAVKLNQASLLTFCSHNEIFKSALKIIVKNTGAILYEVSDIKGELEKLDFLTIKTIGELGKLLKNNEVHYLKFVDLLTTGLKDSIMMTTLPLFYFAHFLACRKLSVDYLKEYFYYGSIKLAGGRRDEEDLIKIYKSTLST